MHNNVDTWDLTQRVLVNITKLRRIQIEAVYMITTGSPRWDYYQGLATNPPITRVDAVLTPSKIDCLIKLSEYGFKHISKFWSNVDYMKQHPRAYGCYISHHSVWKTISKFKSDKWFLVLEDDVNKQHLSSFLSNPSINGSDDCIYNLVRKSYRHDPYATYKYGDSSMVCAAAYLLKQKHACQLLKASADKICAPADRFLFTPWRTGIPTCFHFNIGFNNHNIKSTIMNRT